MVGVRSKLIYFLFLALLLTAVSCSESAPVEPEIPADIPWNNYDYYGQSMELTVYYRNNSYYPGHPEEERVLPVTRSVRRTEAVARAVVRELINGPGTDDIELHDVAPVINTDVILDDIYVVDGICVVHLASAEALPHPGGLSLYEDELVLVESLVRSLTAVDWIDAVWLFQNGSPWQGASIGWCSPLAPVGEPVVYTLYVPELASRISELFGHEENIHDSFSLAIESPLGTTPENCPFIVIINRLLRSHEGTGSGLSPLEIKHGEATLKDGLLKLNLYEAPVLERNTTELFKALVYTFTGLPEIRQVMITLGGQYWDDGSRTWDFPLDRSDFNW